MYKHKTHRHKKDLVAAFLEINPTTTMPAEKEYAFSGQIKAAPSNKQRQWKPQDTPP